MMDAWSIARLVAHYLDARDDIAEAHVEGSNSSEATAVVWVKSQGETDYLITVVAR